MSGQPPVAWEVFNYRDSQQFALMYQWAGSSLKLSKLMTQAGYPVNRNTLNVWRGSHGIPIAQKAYRLRDDPPEVDPLEAEAEPDRDTAAELLEWLQNRVIPDAPGPTAAVNPGAYATCLVCSDLHFPFHHERAFEVFLGLANRIRPTEIVLDGDAFDFAQIGRYTKDPTAHRTLWQDMEDARASILARIPAVSPQSVLRFIVGNHEEGRWKNYLFTRCPEIADCPMLSMEAMLGLTEMGWIWQPYEYEVTDSLIIYHGDRHTSALGGGSAMSARKESIDMGCSTVTGHTHHAGSFFRQDRTGYRVSYELGCMCDWRKMQAAWVTTRRTPTKSEDWHLACALIRYRPGHSAFRVELIPIIDDGRTFAIYQDEEIAA